MIFTHVLNDSFFLDLAGCLFASCCTSFNRYVENVTTIAEVTVCWVRTNGQMGIAAAFLVAKHREVLSAPLRSLDPISRLSDK